MVALAGNSSTEEAETGGSLDLACPTVCGEF